MAAETPVAAGLVEGKVALEDWSRTLSINLTGVFLCMKYEIPVMQSQGGGAIVNVASGSGESMLIDGGTVAR
jgi:NAD(P)-dependent dehydrogenase (short-subunit alcohol dehydrogenase family)